MTNISNRGLTLLILMTLALSVFTTVFSHSQMSRLNDQLSNIQTPTGFATTGSGTASINLTSDLAIILQAPTDLDWGDGIVNQTNPNCEITTLTTTGSTSATLNPNNCWINSSANPSSAFEETDDFHIENTGTETAIIQINGSNSTTFFGWGDATSTNFMWRGVETEGTSCTGTLTGTWTEFDDESTYDNVCTVLEYDNANDELLVELNMTFNRSEVIAGPLTATIDFLALNAS